MAQLRLGELPEEPLAAAAMFHAEVLPRVRAGLAAAPADFTLILAPADYTHRAWRQAAVQALAREYAPIRVNAVTSASEPAIAAALAFLDTAEGITGQLLELDDTGAGEVVSSLA